VVYVLLLSYVVFKRVEILASLQLGHSVCCVRIQLWQVSEHIKPAAFQFYCNKLVDCLLNTVMNMKKCSISIVLTATDQKPQNHQRCCITYDHIVWMSTWCWVISPVIICGGVEIRRLTLTRPIAVNIVLLPRSPWQSKTFSLSRRKLSRRIMESPAYVCLSVCLSVTTITKQKTWTDLDEIFGESS